MERTSADLGRDLEHAKLDAFRRKADRALDAVARAKLIGRVGVSFSGGKDSTVTLDLVRRVIPDAPAALFDSGCELDATMALARHYGVEVIRPRLTFPEMARFSGWWGYRDPVDAGCQWAVKSVIIDEPSEVFVCRQRLKVVAMGLRAEESKGRRMNAIVRGELYQSQDRTWHLCPIAHWTVDDVWAYIASRELRYHPAYDRMIAMGISREGQRLGALLGATGEGKGSFAVLRQVEPDTFHRLAAEFPAIARST